MSKQSCWLVTGTCKSCVSCGRAVTLTRVRQAAPPCPWVTTARAWEGNLSIKIVNHNPESVNHNLECVIIMRSLREPCSNVWILPDPWREAALAELVASAGPQGPPASRLCTALGKAGIAFSSFPQLQTGPSPYPGWREERKQRDSPGGQGTGNARRCSPGGGPGLGGTGGAPRAGTAPEARCCRRSPALGRGWGWGRPRGRGGERRLGRRNPAPSGAAGAEPGWQHRCGQPWLWGCWRPLSPHRQRGRGGRQR